VVWVNGVKVVLEGSYSRVDAENDVKHRIEEEFGDLGVAIYYKESFPSNLTDSELEERSRSSVFEVRLIAPVDMSAVLFDYLASKKVEPRWVTGWMGAKIADLTSILSEAVQFIISEEDVTRVIGDIEQRINEFVESSNSVDQGKQIARNLYDIFYKLYGFPSVIMRT
jgi:hypothetical protein